MLGFWVRIYHRMLIFFNSRLFSLRQPECMDKFKNGLPCPTNPHEEAIVKFWDDLPENYVPVLAETKVFNRN